MKKLLSFLLILVLILGTVACGATEEVPSSEGNSAELPTDTDTDTEISASTEEKEWEPLKVMDDKVLVSDYRNKKIIVYDLSLVGDDGDLNGAEVWVLENAYSASVKYRENTVYGDVILHAANYDASIVDYNTKQVVWEAPGVAGWGVHSIEILPSGNIVTAGATDGILRMFNAANCVFKGDEMSYVDYPGLPSAHGVLWDPEYECLWALGANELVAYEVIDNEDGTQSLRKIGGMGAKLPTGGLGGHDLAADLQDSRYLWITSSKVLRFDKEEGTFTERYPNSSKLNKGNVKGFGNNLNGNFIYTQAKAEDQNWVNAGKESYATDTIVFGFWKSESMFYLKKCVCEGAEFYKARVFYGKYQ